MMLFCYFRKKLVVCCSVFQEFQMKMESLQQRREELERKEFQLKGSLLTFDKFLKVCPTMWCAQPAKAQTSLCIHTV